MKISCKRSWYVIYVMPRHEKKIASILKTRGITFFLPMTKNLRTWNGRKRYVELPLFPSYIFVSPENVSEYYELLNINSVINYVKFGNEIAVVSEIVIDNIRLLEMQHAEMEVSSARFDPGRQVVIKEGTLAGCKAEVVEVKGKEKIIVRVNLLRRNVLINLPSEYLIAFVA
ncbi:transcription termination/antitermination protein NusG [[Flexibacter] sp. ATCC 35208]|uniref:transcription termination/antitermination protein NusG n=1 Tax=[Flexibacter] sp. ATCC 35208 TaxID=1936242 RepID=UPI0009D5BEC7|nr:UpxY family transcription antiterminator [[Flexibacter] sp. ATCC 35208]OMP79333.1 hypothetical protein BW716_09530 [[Flexibacter] sp. ATCC 35208]